MEINKKHLIEHEKPMKFYKYIFKKDLPKWEAEGWEYVRDLFVTGCMGEIECMIKSTEGELDDKELPPFPGKKVFKINGVVKKNVETSN